MTAILKPHPNGWFAECKPCGWEGPVEAVRGTPESDKDCHNAHSHGKGECPDGDDCPEVA